MSLSTVRGSYNLIVDIICSVSACTGAPPAYMSSVNDPAVLDLHQQQQQLPSAGYYSSVPSQPTDYDAGDLPAKM